MIRFFDHKYSTAIEVKRANSMELNNKITATSHHQKRQSHLHKYIPIK